IDRAKDAVEDDEAMVLQAGQSQRVVSALWERFLKCFAAWAQQLRPDLSEHQQEGTVRLDHVIAAIGIIIAQRGQDGRRGIAQAEFSSQEPDRFGGEGQVSIGILQVGLRGQAVVLALPAVRQEVPREENEIGVWEALASVVEAALEQGVIAIGSQGIKP